MPGTTATLGAAALTLLATAAVPTVAAEPISATLRAYGELPSFVERLDMSITLPDGRQESKILEYGRSGSAAFVALGQPGIPDMLRIVVRDERVYASQFNVTSAYVARPRASTLTETLEEMGATAVGLFLPPSLAAAEGADAFYRSLRFAMLEPLTVTRVDEREGRATVELTATNGSCTLSIDGEGYLEAVAATIGDPSRSVRMDGRITRGPLAADDPRLHFETGDRSAVGTFAEMEAAAYPLGTPAPDATAPTLTGDSVSLAELRGSVVILDFWATWCVPCWGALESIEELAAWARESGLPVVVWAVDTLEPTTDLSEQTRLAREFLEERGLDVRSLVDVDDSFFGALHSPGLPSTVVIAPDGTLAHYHSGVADDMTEVLRREALELLGSER